MSLYQLLPGMKVLASMMDHGILASGIIFCQLPKALLHPAFLLLKASNPRLKNHISRALVQPYSKEQPSGNYELSCHQAMPNTLLASPSQDQLLVAEKMSRPTEYGLAHPRP